MTNVCRLFFCQQSAKLLSHNNLDCIKISVYLFSIWFDFNGPDIFQPSSYYFGREGGACWFNKRVVNNFRDSIDDVLKNCPSICIFFFLKKLIRIDWRWRRVIEIFLFIWMNINKGQPAVVMLDGTASRDIFWSSRTRIVNTRDDNNVQPRRKTKDGRREFSNPFRPSLKNRLDCRYVSHWISM